MMNCVCVEWFISLDYFNFQPDPNDSIFWFRHIFSWKKNISNDFSEWSVYQTCGSPNQFKWRSPYLTYHWMNVKPSFFFLCNGNATWTVLQSKTHFYAYKQTETTSNKNEKFASQRRHYHWTKSLIPFVIWIVYIFLLYIWCVQFNGLFIEVKPVIS